MTAPEGTDIEIAGLVRINAVGFNACDYRCGRYSERADKRDLCIAKLAPDGQRSPELRGLNKTFLQPRRPLDSLELPHQCKIEQYGSYVIRTSRRVRL